ncbi:hypothetical protein PK04_03035 [Salmonella enterica subsp. enterica]|nr:hypothetical protein [Salmonella enterica subsp. enterica]
MVDSELKLKAAYSDQSVNIQSTNLFRFAYTNSFILSGSEIPASAMTGMVKEVELITPVYIDNVAPPIPQITLTTNLASTGNDAISVWERTDVTRWKTLLYESIAYKFKDNGVFNNVDQWWCGQNVSAGTIQTGGVSVAGNGTAVMSYWARPQPPALWNVNTSPQITWREIPSLNISLITPVLDFGTAYTGITARKELKFTLTSNVISAPVNVTYTLTPVTGSATVNIAGTTQNGTEQVTTSATKNDVKEITRMVEITGSEGVGGGYEGRLQIVLEIP